jgi:hypothetical protein
MTSEELSKLSLDELAKIRTNKIAESLPAILIDKEFEHRARIEQHELDLKLVARQVRWMKFSAILGIISALAGAIVGAYLQYRLSQPPSLKSPSPIQKENASSTPLHQTTISKSSSNPVKK